VRASKLFGSQSLARYAGWRGGPDDVARELEANRRIGEATGCWKGGYLVEDEGGSVRKYLAAAAAEAAAAAAGGGGGAVQ